MKVRAIRNVILGGSPLDRGEVIDLPDSVAQRAVMNGYAEATDAERDVAQGIDGVISTAVPGGKRPDRKRIKK